MPEFPTGAQYVAVAAGPSHTVLLRNDGTAIAVGSNCSGQCTVPELPAGAQLRPQYVIVATGFEHTVLLRNDGTSRLRQNTHTYKHAHTRTHKTHLSKVAPVLVSNAVLITLFFRSQQV